CELGIARRISTAPKSLVPPLITSRQLDPELALLGLTLAEPATKAPPLLVKTPVVEPPTPSAPVMVREAPAAREPAPRFPRMLTPPLVRLITPPALIKRRAALPETWAAVFPLPPRTKPFVFTFRTATRDSALKLPAAIG